MSTDEAREGEKPDREGYELTRRGLLGGAAAVGGIGLAAALLQTAGKDEASAATLPQVDVGGVFVLEVEGVTGFFTEVSGLGSETEVIEYKQTEDRSVIQKIPGRLKWNDITLKRGVTTDLDVSKWRKLVEDGDIEAARKDGSIALMGADGSPVAAWSFEAAWPSKISAGHSKLLSDDVMILEELVLVVEQVRRAAR